MEVRLVAATTHGRAIVRRVDDPRGLLVGFHGYMENADIQMARLATIPGSDRWTLLSVEALHRFYKRRSESIAASWMVRQDRDVLIDDNIAYVDAALGSIDHAAGAPIVFAGFSQGVAMAFRAAVRGRFGAVGVIAVGGDVPPELLADPGARFPRVTLIRGAGDEWYSEARMQTDVVALTTRGVAVTSVVCGGGHEWTDEGSAAAGRFLDAVA